MTGARRTPQFSIVAITRNGADAVRCLLLSIDRLDFPKDQFEVIVVDDGSEEPTATQVREDFQFALKHISLKRTAKSSRSRARNAGALVASGAYLIFVDGDSFLEPEFLSNYQRYFETNRQRKVVAGKRKHVSIGLVAEVEESMRNLDVPVDVPVFAPDGRTAIVDAHGGNFESLQGRWMLFFSCNFCIEKELFHTIEGFDESFLNWGLEDTDLGYRLYMSGHEFDLIDNHVCHFLDAIPLPLTNYRGWLTNLRFFITKYDDLRILECFNFDDFFLRISGTSIEANGVSDPSMNPQELFAQTYARFEAKLRHLEKNGLLKRHLVQEVSTQKSTSFDEALNQPTWPIEVASR